jgi:hypothetical protein
LCNRDYHWKPFGKIQILKNSVNNVLLLEAGNFGYLLVSGVVHNTETNAKARNIANRNGNSVEGSVMDSSAIIECSQLFASQRHAALVSGAMTSEEVINRIEDAVASIIEMMDEQLLPSIRSSEEKCLKRFTLAQSRSFTSILMVLSYCHSLLGHKRSTTTREVYYFFVTHFRNQRECDHTIWESAELLGVPRTSLGLAASPKGKNRLRCCFLCFSATSFKPTEP